MEHFKKEITVWGLSANMINIMVGAGIFVLPAIVAEGLGKASIFAYLLCGFLIAMVMLCFAEIGSKITGSGGVYAYMQASFGKYAGFITSSLFLLSTIAADAAVAHAIANILTALFPFFAYKIVETLFFILLFSGLAYLNIRGVKEGIGFVKLITLAKIIPLLFLVVMGAGEINIANLSWHALPSAKSLGEISLILFFAFQGGETGLSVSGEVRTPNKTIPRAIFLSVIGTLVLYILIQTLSQGILGDTLANTKENPLGEVANKLIGPIGLTLLTIGAGVSMFGNLSSEILSMPRVLYAISRDEVIPIKILSRIHKKYATPYMSIALYASIGLLFTLIGGFEQMAIISSAAILLIYLMIAIAVIKLRRKGTSGPATAYFKIPGGYLVPILSSLTILWFLSNLSLNEYVGMGLFIGVLTMIYFLIITVKKRQAQKNT